MLMIALFGAATPGEISGEIVYSAAGTPCIEDSSILGAHNRLRQNATNTTQSGVLVLHNTAAKQLLRKRQVTIGPITRKRDIIHKTVSTCGYRQHT